MTDLEYRIETVDGLGDDTVGDIFTLYSRYYDGTSEQLFRRDLAEKQYVIVLRGTGGRVQGFSTQVVTEHRFEGAPIRTNYFRRYDCRSPALGTKGPGFHLAPHERGDQSGCPRRAVVLVQPGHGLPHLPLYADFVPGFLSSS